MVFLREFILGNNDTGRVVDQSKTVGGNFEALAGQAIVGEDDIFTGAGVTQGTVTVPSATVSNWIDFLQTATSTPSGSDVHRSDRHHHG